MANYAKYVQDGEDIDYTPTADVAAGAVVVQGDLVGVAKRPIAANALGALSTEGVFDFPKAITGGSGLAVGTTVYWDATNSVATATSIGNKQLGKVIKTAADADTTVRVRMDSMAAASSNPIASVIADPGNGQAIPVTASGHVDIVTAAAETRGLAVPTFAGQELLISMKTDGGDCVITVADPHIDGTNNTITLNDAGDTVRLVSGVSGAGFVWRLSFNVGAYPQPRVIGMVDLLQQAAGWLADKRRQHLAHPVTYCRDDETVEVPATVGSSSFEIDDGYGGVERFESRDFLVAVADLVLDGQSILPRAGDEIHEQIGQQVTVYQVMAPAKQPCWRYSDPYRNTLRIHTKQVGNQ